MTDPTIQYEWNPVVDMESTSSELIDEWEYVDPIVDESKYQDEFDQEFLKSDTWRQLLRLYPKTYEEHYKKWKGKFKNRVPTRTEIGVFHWQVTHRYLPQK